MSPVLSQEEIDALLTAASDQNSSGGHASAFEGDPRTSVIGYNFRRPDRVTKDQIRSLHFLHDRFARNVSTSMSAYMRVVTDVTILSVEQFTYSEFLMSLSDPTAFYAISMRPLEGVAALELNPSVAFTMIDRMLGGSGRGVAVNRALTDIEQNVTDGVVKLILENLTDAWRGIVDVQFRISGRETRPQMLQVAAPNEIVIMIVFDVRIGDVRGMMNLCIPASIAETMGGVQAWQPHHRAPTATERAWLQMSLGAVELDVSAVLESKLLTSDLLALSAGDVISLGVPADRPIDVRVGGTLKFKGRLGVGSRGRPGVRIERRCDSAMEEEG